jgi:hypothetical protein
VTTQADSETLILGAGPRGSSGQVSRVGQNISRGLQNQPLLENSQEETAILAGGQSAASDAVTKRNIDTLQNRISGKTDHGQPQERRRWPRALIAAACAGGLALAAGTGFYGWSQFQAQKAALAAHEKAMEQIEEQEHALAEQQRLNEIQRQQELQRQAALRQ